MSAAATHGTPVSGWRKFFALDLLDNRYPALHGLRVLGILSVIQYHVTWIFSGEQGIPIDATFMDVVLRIFFGMDLFFVLSGFLIGSILLRSLEVSGTQNIKRFYLRRIFRTFPSYYVVLTILALTMPLTALQREHLIYEYTYLTNFVELHRPAIIMFWGWSLAFEEQFYLTVPALFWLLQRLGSDRARIGFLAFLMLVALVVRLGIYYSQPVWGDLALYSEVYFRTYSRFDTIVCGILLAFIEAKHGEAIGRWLEHPFHRALLALPAAGCLWVLMQPTMFGTEHVQLVRMFLWGTVTSVMYLAFLPLVLHGDSVVHRFFSAPIFRRIATLGYGVYLVHIPIIDHVMVPAARWLHDHGATAWSLWPVSMLATSLASLAVAYLMHVFIEKPSLRVREMLAA